MQKITMQNEKTNGHSVLDTESPKRVPKLRFKEFSVYYQNYNLIELSTNGFSNGAFNDPKKIGKGYRIINVKDMYVDGTINVDALTRVDIDVKEFNSNRVEYGDIFFTRSSLVKEGIAHSNINLSLADDLTFDGHLIRIRPIANIAIPLYLYFNLKSHGVRKQLVAKGKTTTMTTIGQSDIAKTKINLPTFPEQQKIADCLSTWDESIENLKQIIEAKKFYKKGMMQKIFSQEIRFKDDDGADYPAWVEKKLGECIKHIGGTSLEKYVSDDSTYKFISIGNYSKSGRYIDNGQRVLLNDKTKTKLLNKNDLVMVLNDKTSSGDIIGSTILVKKDDEYIYNQRSERIICGSLIFPLFLWHLLNFEKFRQRVFSLSQGGTQIYINFSAVKSIDFLVPTIGEQTKIANFLSAIDEDIELLESQLTELDLQKKGLMQGMFV
ncbi:restriction endonuclease subunit S [Francisellaceae bacterium CB52]